MAEQYAVISWDKSAGTAVDDIFIVSSLEEADNIASEQAGEHHPGDRVTVAKICGTYYESKKEEIDTADFSKWDEPILLYSALERPDDNHPFDYLYRLSRVEALGKMHQNIQKKNRKFGELIFHVMHPLLEYINPPTEIENSKGKPVPCPECGGNHDDD